MGVKSGTCFSRKGKPLTEYYTETDAVENADFVRQSYGRKVRPYRCEKCGMWHLAPENRHTPSRKCSICTDSSGNRKELYFSKHDAQRRADIIRKENGVSLNVYQCPAEEGWHLTSS